MNASLATMRSTSGRSERLRPYVPRLLIDWLRLRPGDRYQEIEGSLAFVDISGFTTMTERLARKGKVGAEEVSDTLDTCFTELLSVAYDYGAGVVKWGGDAVLLLFMGEEHAPRACRAAAGMQRTIRRIGRLRTSAGLVTLRMSIGIHSGVFDFFLVGDLHRELIITGPGASMTVAMESAADAGEIALSPGTAAALDPRFLGARKGSALLLKGEPDATSERAAPAPDVAGLELERCLPLQISDHLLAEGDEAEHRTIAVAFVEFSGTDKLLEREGSEAVADALDECIRTVQHATDRHQVALFETDVSGDGGKIVLISGAPRSAGNDEERMLRAVRAIMDRPGRLPLRIGVNCGHVFAGNFGPPYRRTYSVKGDAVNLAARVMGKAAPGQILATEAIVKRSRATFDLEALEPFMVKGKAQTVQAYGVGPLTGAGGGTVTSTPFLGRDRELATLVEALDSAREWQGRIVEIVAEPGMGKSRLVEELRARAEGVIVVGAVCEEYEASTPYFAFRDLLRGLLGLAGNPADLAEGLRDTVATTAPHLLPWLPLIALLLQVEVPPTPETDQLEEQFRKPRLEDAVGELLGNCLLTPTLLVFEDVHWLDDASGDLLRHLTGGIEDRPWLIVVTRREATTGFVAPQEDTVITIRLDPLAAEEAAALAEGATAEAPLPPHELAALTERAGGNPLFLAELVAAAKDAGGVEALPDSIEGVMTAQIDRLPPRERAILRYASVLGVTFSPDLLSASLTRDQDPPDESAWRRLGDFVLPQKDGQLRFRHALVRDAAYEGLSFRRRRELHARVGETIERRAPNPEDEAALLSLHFFHAQRFEDAWRYSRVAGGRAQEIYANVEAAASFERALEAVRRLDGVPAGDVAKVSEALGDVRVRLGEFERAGLAYRASRRRTSADAVEQARLMLKEALIPWKLGRYPQSLRWLTRGLRVLEGSEGAAAAAERARLYAWYGVVRQKQGRRQFEAIEWCRRAIVEAEKADAPDALAHAYNTLDWAYVTLGRFEDAVYSSQALAIYEELGNLHRQAVVLNNLGVIAHLRGRWDESVDLYERAHAAWEKAGDRWSASFPSVNKGEVLSDQGRQDEAEPLFREALRIARASRATSRVADVSRYLGTLAARAGRFDEARTLLREALAEFEQTGEQSEVLTTEARTAECFVLQGDSKAALALASATLARARAPEGAPVLVPMLQRLRGCALMQLGRLDEAREALAESLADARSKEAEYEIALALDAFVELGALKGDPTAEVEEERRAIFDRLGVVRIPEIPLAPAPSG
jgi:class 3 adenylate cyclase/tetratricopeptide (TPR) repeat protein